MKKLNASTRRWTILSLVLAASTLSGCRTLAAFGEDITAMSRSAMHRNDSEEQAIEPESREPDDSFSHALYESGSTSGGIRSN